MPLTQSPASVSLDRGLRTMIIVGGVLNLLFALFHLLLPWLFRWRENLQPLTPNNRAIMYTFHWVIIFLLLAFSYLTIAQTSRLVGTFLGRFVLFMIGTVWLIRSTTEVFVFRIGVEGAVWRLALFLTIAALFLFPALRSSHRTG